MQVHRGLSHSAGTLKIRRRKIFKNNNLFEIVKLNITTRQAAEAYGFRPNRSSMICCPFHADRNPSMKVDFRFHCFGCGADGDVIDFTAKLFQLSLRQAAEKLATDFGLSATDNFQPLPCKPVEKPLSPKDQFYKILCGYRSLLADWRMAYAPKKSRSIPASLFCSKSTLCRPCAISAGYSFAGKSK